ncbi:alkaline phosphatase [Powellomyces hirtus]|nr:alkaline phosphatase [Powellomyces hirtus]
MLVNLSTGLKAFIVLFWVSSVAAQGAPAPRPSIVAEPKIVDNIAFSSPIINVPALAKPKPNVDAIRNSLMKGRPAGLKAFATSFEHGVASGDPTADAVILWTKVTTTDPSAVPVTYQVAATPDFAKVVASAVVVTDQSVDHTVKVDIKGLNPNTTYYYRFTTAAGVSSPVGKTHTLPPANDTSVANYKLAVVSCSSYPHGFFNSYAGIGRRQDVDIVVHLGDYIYEYANGEYGDGSSIGRVPVPNKEITTLEDYRTRHASYKKDSDLQAAHLVHPWITVWDDHEFANDAWEDGAENHDPEKEGPWIARKANAIRAYFEYMPIRPAKIDASGHIYRSFQVGKLFDLIMLDTRVDGRSETGVIWPWKKNDPKRTILGFDQEAWLNNQLAASKSRGAKWRFLGNQVLFSPLKVLGITILYDSWDDYPAARNRLLDFMEQNAIKDTVILTGDIHTAFAINAPGKSANSAMVELVTTSVTSPGAGSIPTGALKLANKHIKYGNGGSRGYLLVSINQEKVTAEFIAVDTIAQRATGEKVDAVIETKAGSGVITSLKK